MGQKYEEAEKTLMCILQDSFNNYSLEANSSNEETFHTKDFRQGMALAPNPQPTVLDRLKERLVVALKKNQEKQVHRMEDQLPPACSPSRRPRSASICSVSLPDTKQIVQESLGQGLPIIPFGFPSFVIVDVESEQEFDHNTSTSASDGRKHNRSSEILEEPSLVEAEEFGQKKENSMIEKREGLRKKKEKTRKMLARLRKPVSRQDEWRMEGHNKTDYMFLDFSK